MNTSRAYFADIADQWDSLRSGYFTTAMRDAVVRRANIAPQAVVADVGTGTGFMLQGLLDSAETLVGFDESSEMLAVATKNLAGQDKVTFQVTDGRHLPAPDASFDAVFANMFLHHTADPHTAVQEMARILKTGGKLIITDLDRHNQAWMRETMADRWLGFDREDIRHWYQEAGLTAIDIDYADGTCRCAGADEQDIALSIFVAIGRKH